MSGKLRSHLASTEPYAWIRSNILGLVAIFIALGGSAAAATVVIQHDSKGSAKAKASKKAKAGPRGPAGAPGAQGAQGAQGPGGGAGATGAQGPSALKLDYDKPNTESSFTTIGTQDELLISADCFHPGVTEIEVNLTSSVPATVNWSDIKSGQAVTTTAEGNGRTLDPGTQNNLFITSANSAGGNGFSRIVAQAVYRNASRVITLDLSIIANDDSGRCQVQGTAVPAS
jgi:hypothetical protein